MRVGTASDAVYSAIIWFPILAIIALFIFALSSGLQGLEKISFGTEYFVSNAETTNVLEPAGGASYADQLIAAMDTQDPEQAQAQLDRIEAQQQALADDRLQF
jgi:hypothetical protein